MAKKGKGNVDWKQTADPARLAIAELILMRYNNDDNNVQALAKESPEFYRTCMYNLHPGAMDIDGTPEYWQIVRYFEALICDDGEVIEDWND